MNFTVVLVLNSFSHNRGSGKWLYLKGNYYWRYPFSTSMIMGGRVRIGNFLPTKMVGHGYVEVGDV